MPQGTKKSFLLRKMDRLDLIHESIVAEQQRLWAQYEQISNVNLMDKATVYVEYKKTKQAADVVLTAIQSLPF